MKKIFTKIILLAILVLVGLGVNAQTVVIGSTTSGGTSSYFYGPVYRSTAGSTFNYSRYAHLYTAAELGIPANSNITKIEWLKASAATITGSNTFNVFLSNSASTALTSGSSWTALTAGSTQVLASTTTSVTGAADTYWGTPALGSPYLYTGGSLVIMTDWVKAGTASAVLPFYTNAAIGKGIGAASSAALTGATTLGITTYGDNRPTIRISYTASVACSGTPTAGTTVASPTIACPTASLAISVSGGDAGTGLTYVWEKSLDNISYTAISGVTTEGYSASQTTATWYRRVTTCTASGLSSTSTPVQVTMNPFLSCYCVTSPSSGGTTDIITNVTMGTLNSTTTFSTTAPAYFTSYSNTPETLTQGTTIPLSITVGSDGTQHTAVWIDFDQSGTYDATENVALSTAAAGASAVVSYTLTIPASATLGQTKMRVRGGSDGAYTAAGACTASTYGETEDYLVNIIANNNCAGTPAPGATSKTGASTVCSGVPFTLSVVTPTLGSGVTILWESAADAAFTAPTALGTTATQVIASQTTATYYRCTVTCAGGGTGVSTALFVGQNAATNCYCTPVTSSGCTGGDVIAQVILNTLNNNTGTGCPSGAGGNGYSDYTTNAALTTTLQAGSTYNCTVFAGEWDESYAAWIDYNDDGTFDPTTERIGFTATAVTGSGTPGVLGSSASFPITLLCNPPLGVHRLRVRAMYNIAGSAVTPCANNTYGEVEDYLITIAAADPCPTPSAGLSSAITQTGAELTWTTGCAETSWDVHVTTAGSGAPTGAASDPGVTKPYVKTGLTAGTAYEYWVRAVCTPGSLFSSWAGPFTFTTLPLAPNCATYVTPLAGANLLAPAPIDWDAPTTGGVPSGYKVYIDLTAAPTTLVTTTAAAVTAYVPTALVAGSTYYYQVVPTNSAGDATGCAVESFVYTVPPPPVNDDPANATALVLGTQVCQNTSFATVGTEETASNLATVWVGSSLNNTVFYKFTPTVPGKYNLTLSSPATSTQVMQTWAGIYTYIAPTFTEVTAPVSNTTAAGLSSIYLTATLTAGVEYTIMVEGFSGSFGDFCIQLDPSCVGNSGIGMLAAGANPLTQMCGDALSTFTYYGITSGGANQYCLAIEWGTNTASKAYAEANNTISMFKSASVTNDVGGPGAGVSTLGQYWNVGLDAASQLTTPVRVQFYYTPADLAAVTTAAGTFGTATTPVWFKTEGVAFSLNNPALQNQTTGQYIGMTQLTAAAPVVDPNGQTYVQLSGITSFSGGSVAVAGGLATPLPLKLVSYKGAARGAVNELSWTTASEENIREFMVERSVDGKNWITVVGKTTAKGSKTTKQTYTMTDNNPVCAAYYRLTSMENDGRTEKLGTVQILRRCEKFNIASVFPNPSSDKVNVQYESTNDADILVTVLDMTGRVVLTSSTTALIGFNTTELDLSGLTSGTYIISMNNGQNIVTSRVTKN